MLDKCNSIEADTIYPILSASYEIFLFSTRIFKN